MQIPIILFGGKTWAPAIMTNCDVFCKKCDDTMMQEMNDKGWEFLFQVIFFYEL